MISEGQLTLATASLLLNRSLIRNDRFPTRLDATSLMLVNGLINMSAPGERWEATCSATPVPIDMPMRKISFSSTPN